MIGCLLVCFYLQIKDKIFNGSHVFFFVILNSFTFHLTSEKYYIEKMRDIYKSNLNLVDF